MKKVRILIKVENGRVKLLNRGFKNPKVWELKGIVIAIADMIEKQTGISKTEFFTKCIFETL